MFEFESKVPVDLFRGPVFNRSPATLKYKTLYFKHSFIHSSNVKRQDLNQTLSRETDKINVNVLIDISQVSVLENWLFGRTWLCVHFFIMLYCSCIKSM